MREDERKMKENERFWRKAVEKLEGCGKRKQISLIYKHPFFTLEKANFF
jgi:hypothetical protein